MPTNPKRELPKVNCRLVGEDSNAFFIMGRFQEAAYKAGWTATEVNDLMNEAMSSDYNHLLATISKHCKRP
mgnify:CR=1 FL=1